MRINEIKRARFPPRSEGLTASEGRPAIPRTSRRTPLFSLSLKWGRTSRSAGQRGVRRQRRFSLSRQEATSRSRRPLARGAPAPTAAHLGDPRVHDAPVRPGLRPPPAPRGPRLLAARPPRLPSQASDTRGPSRADPFLDAARRAAPRTQGRPPPPKGRAAEGGGAAL